MRTTLELLELLRDKGNKGFRGLCFQVVHLKGRDFINKEEENYLSDYLAVNLPRKSDGYKFNSNTERYEWLDAQIEKLKQEEK